MTTVFGFYVHHRANGVPFYVGKGTEMRARLMSRKNNKFHQNVVAKEGKENIKVTFTPCESEAEAFEKEVALIALYRAIGIELVNATDGGEGPSNPKPEVRAKISAAIKQSWDRPGHREKMRTVANTPAQREGARERGKARKGVPLSPEHRAAIKAYLNAPEVKQKRRLSQLGKKVSAETRAKMSETHKAMCKDPAHREKMRKARLGKKLSLETRQKIGAAHKALWEKEGYKEQHKLTDERKAKISAKSKKLWATPEYREKISRALTGKIKSPEARERISASLKVSLNTPEAKENKRKSVKFREANQKKAIAFWSTSDARSKASDRLKNLWANPEYRAKVLAARKRKKNTSL